jgi:hypothetical protein
VSQIKIDPATGDVARQNGRMQIATGGEEIRQHVDIRLRLFQGEAFYDTDRGTPWRTIFVKGSRAALVQKEIADVIGGTPGVAQVVEVVLADFFPERRNVRIEWEAVGSLPDLRQRIPIHDTINPFQVTENG